MAKDEKKLMNIFEIIFKGSWIYVKNFMTFFNTMLFPLFGQLLGILMILVPSFIFSQNMPRLLYQYPYLNNIFLVFSCLLLLTLPGFFIFTKAFWEYLVRMISLNTIASDLIKSGKAGDIQVHNQKVSARTRQYIILLAILALIWVVGLLLPYIVVPLNIDYLYKQIFFWGGEALMIIFLTILSVYLSLTYQVFAFETISPQATLKRSIELVEGNFFRTVILAVIIFALTSAIIPSFIQSAFANTSLFETVMRPCELYTSTLISDPYMFVSFFHIEKYMDMQGGSVIFELSKILLFAIIGFITTGLLLPFGSACYTLLYQDIQNRKGKSSAK
ncbi:MAG: hypothetical protein PHV68_01480 [Candidatus Gastranaerophilales bacterium]|nr:hypothetical protein [Candidatus Gastranaerophilales bacterium]